MPTMHQEPMDTELLIQILRDQKILPNGYNLEFEATHQGKKTRPEKISQSNPPTVLLCDAETRINTLTLDRERRPLCGDIWFRVIFYDRHGMTIGDVQPPPFADNQLGPKVHKGKTIAEIICERGLAARVYAALLLCYEDTGIVSYQLMYNQQHLSEVPTNTDASL